MAAQTSLPIYIRTLTGESVCVKVKPSESVYGVKTRIVEKLGIAPENQRLIFNGTPMNDEGCLREHCVSNGSTIYVVRRLKAIQIHLYIINSDSGGYINVEAKANSTVKELKGSIYKREGIPVHKQLLMYGGHPLEDKKQLLYYHIVSTASALELRVCHFDSGQIFVETPDGKCVKLAVNAVDTIKTIKTKIESRIRIPANEQRLIFSGKQLKCEKPVSFYGIRAGSTIFLSLRIKGGMQIYVRIGNTKSIAVVIEQMDTISQFKARVNATRLEGVPLEDQQLYYHGKFLEDCKTLQFYNVTPEASLDMSFAKEEYVNVIVETSPNTNFPLIVKASDTVWALKVLLQKMNAISPECQTLIFCNKILEDNNTLKQCGVTNNYPIIYQIVSYMPKVQLFLNGLTGRTSVCEISLLNSVWELKAMVYKNEGIHPYAQRLLFSGKQLEDGRRLADYSIQAYHTFFLVLRLRGMSIFVKTPVRIFCFPVNSTGTIRNEVMAKIDQMQGLSITKSCLIYSGVQLQDDKTLEHYNITEEDILYLVPCLCVQLQTKVIRLLNIHYNDTIAVVKAQIQKNEEIPPKSQWLTLDNELMSDDKSLYHYTLDLGATLILHESPPLSPIEVFVYSVAGRISINSYSAATTIGAIKHIISIKQGFALEKQRLIFSDVTLEDSKCLGDYNIIDGSILYLDSQIMLKAISQDSLEKERGAKSEALCALHFEQQSRLEAERNLNQAQDTIQNMQEAHERAVENEEELRRRLGDVQEAMHCHEGSNKPDISPWKVSRSDVSIVSEIGVGAWGVVAKGTYNGQQVAIKYPHQLILNEDTLKRLERETELMTQVRHPNLIRIVAAVFDEQCYQLRAPPMIVTELLDMNLRQCYEQRRLIPSSKIPIFQDVAYGLHYLHDRREPIIHRDVSAPNVLLQGLLGGMWRAKVSDFGSANLARLSRTAGEGAIVYTAPEAFPQTDPEARRKPHTVKIDVYSYGILLCEVTTGTFPDPEQYLDMLEQIKHQSIHMYRLIVSCTKQNPDKRPTMACVLDSLSIMKEPDLD